MVELVVPETIGDVPHLDDNRLSLTRDMVGRRVFVFEGDVAAARSLASDLSEETEGAPVLVNDVRSQTEASRTLDVYMHRDGQPMSVSEDVERPR